MISHFPTMPSTVSEPMPFMKIEPAAEISTYRRGTILTSSIIILTLYPYERMGVPAPYTA